VTPEPEELAQPLESELAAIERALGSHPGAGELGQLKHRIVSLFKRIENTQITLSDLKERIRPLVVRYKELSGAPTPDVPPRRNQLALATYIERGWHLIALGEPAEAMRVLSQASELAPDNVEARSLLGWAQLRAGREDEAMATFAVVLAREPDNALARMNVGYLCLRKRAFGEAIEQLSRVIRLDSDPKATLYAHYYLGLVYLERGMLDDARTLLARSIALGPNLLEARAELGRAEWLARNPDLARAEWRRGIEAGPDSPGGRRCRELLLQAERGESLASPG